MDFTVALLKWYSAHRRNLPWKHTKDPYKIWLSEIILQQTRVEQGEPYYLRFVKRFPTVQSLADADIDEVLRLWQGLGYYSRARNLHHTAQQVAVAHKGIFPTSYKILLKLKGIGPYTAAAIASFAGNESVAALDGNGYRILSRVFGVNEPMDTAKGKKQFAQLANELVSAKHPADFNQALMDFGSLVCVPAKPKCADCPLQAGCIALAHHAVDKFPVKSKRTTIRRRFFHYLFIKHNGHTFIRKRTEKDIWQSLYEFPLIETTQPVAPKQLVDSHKWQQFFGKTPFQLVEVSDEIKHQLTHQTLYGRFYIIDVHTVSETLQSACLKVPIATLDDYSLPRLLTVFLENLQDV